MEEFLFSFILCFIAFWTGVLVEWIRGRKYRREIKFYHEMVIKQHCKRTQEW